MMGNFKTSASQIIWKSWGFSPKSYFFIRFLGWIFNNKNHEKTSCSCARRRVVPFRVVFGKMCTFSDAGATSTAMGFYKLDSVNKRNWILYLFSRHSHGASQGRRESFDQVYVSFIFAPFFVRFHKKFQKEPFFWKVIWPNQEKKTKIAIFEIQ